MITAPAPVAPTGTPYDDVVYPSHPIHYASLEQLAMTAAVFGMTPAPLERCRVLELGCSDGGNLLPQAERLPHARFVGLDLSPRQIEMGQKTLAATGLTNVELRAGSILDVTPDWGKFDYIYCHGVYSWVPADVRDKILDVCRHNLADHGVAFVSYNTYPGWHLKQSVREMMVFHASRFRSPAERVGQARALLDFLVKSTSEGLDNAAYTTMLKQTAQEIRQLPDYYLLHEYLEDINQPCYFYEFVNAATLKGLQYLGEVHVALMSTSLFNPDVEKTLRAIAPDIIHMEQYMDFLRNRAFRQSLLCLPDVALNRNLTGAIPRTCHVASDLKPAGPVDLASAAPASFNGPVSSVTVTDPLSKAALLHLGETIPHFTPFDDLVRAARQRLPEPSRAAADSPAAEALLADNLIRLYTTNQVTLRLRDQDWARTLPEKPRATPLARLQASQRQRVASLAHDLPSLTLLEYALLPLLDGTRDKPALIEELRKLIQQNVLVFQGAPDPSTNPVGYDQVLSLAVDQALTGLLPKRLLTKP